MEKSQMRTKIFTPKQLKEAAQLIRNGELLAFPTETVYGLGANALDSLAVKKIFKAKGRPSDNPLIIHIAKKEQLFQIAFIEPWVLKIIQKFWPGPLTVILKSKQIVSKHATGGLNTIAVRMPKNKIALKLIKLAGVPIAAPSANISGKPSGTSFEHVFDDFNGKISGIIKSSPSEIGLESTVIDLTTKTPTLLRPGAFSFEELKKTLPNLLLLPNKKTTSIKSPGMKYKHYSPNAKIILFEKSAINKMQPYQIKYKKLNKITKIINSKNHKKFAKELFNIFRQSDKEKVDVILISAVNENKIGLAIMNRIRKAATEIVK
jgi:L-threonylcarbamoyladenylate synthase